MAVAVTCTRRRPHLRRILEILPGLCTYFILTSLVWASIFFPFALAACILAYDAYWLYRSTALGIRTVVAYRRLRHSEAFDWLSAAAALPGFERLHHLLIVPTYGESVDVLRATLRAMAEQDFPRERITVTLAFEARDPQANRRARLLTQEFEGQFGQIWASFHPDIPNEVAGKSSNEAWAARFATERLVESEIDLDWTTITTCDADSHFSPKYFSALAYEFLTKPRRRVYQPVILFYSNIWRVPAPSRVLNSVHSLWQLARMTRTDKLVPQSTYSMALSTCIEAGYWDTDVIPEDSHMFFKLLFRFGEEMRVEPIYLPVVSDAAESRGYVRTLHSQFNQEKRWAWGVADVPYVAVGLWHALRKRRWKAGYRCLRYMEEHQSWPLSPILITFGAGAPGFFNHHYAQSAIGHLLPSLCSYLLTASLMSMAVMIWVDVKLKPAGPTRATTALKHLLEWLLMPAVGVGLSALPGLVSHTRLLTGRYLEYNVTEKRPAPEPLPVLQMEQVPVSVINTR